MRANTPSGEVSWQGRRARQGGKQSGKVDVSKVEIGKVSKKREEQGREGGREGGRSRAPSDFIVI